MTNLRCSAAEESEDTLNAFTSPTKSAVAFLKKRVIAKKEDLLPTNVTIDRGNLMRGVIKTWSEDHLNVDHLMHDTWAAYFKT